MTGPEAAEERSIVSAARTLGFAVFSFAQGYRPDHSTRQTKGIPDLYLVHPKRGLRLWWETKAPGRTRTDSQERFAGIVSEAGGEVRWGDFEDFLDQLEEMGFPLEGRAMGGVG